MITVTKPYLPSREKLDHYLDGIYERNWLTNNGPLVQELTRRLEEHLGVENLLLVANGTLALQIAYRALGIAGTDQAESVEAVTTPFSFIATSSSLKWEGLQPVFADIDPDSWCLDPERMESAISANTGAIVPVHVFGNACEVEVIDGIASRHGLPVIYDASHAFGISYKDESLLRWGDAATLSFHATKVFHTLEGGAIVFRKKRDLETAKNLINFGITGPGQVDCLGINAKMNEFQAAMGLCVLDEMEQNEVARREIWDRYKERLEGKFQLQKLTSACTNNYSYFPVLLANESATRQMLETMKQHDILTRRYFYPSLDTLSFLADGNTVCVNSRDVSSRALCLPIYPGLEPEDQEKVMGLLCA